MTHHVGLSSQYFLFLINLVCRFLFGKNLVLFVFDNFSPCPYRQSSRVFFCGLKSSRRLRLMQKIYIFRLGNRHDNLMGGASSPRFSHLSCTLFCFSEPSFSNVRSELNISYWTVTRDFRNKSCCYPFPSFKSWIWCFCGKEVYEAMYLWTEPR